MTSEAYGNRAAAPECRGSAGVHIDAKAGVMHSISKLQTCKPGFGKVGMQWVFSTMANNAAERCVADQAIALFRKNVSGPMAFGQNTHAAG